MIQEKGYTNTEVIYLFPFFGTSNSPPQAKPPFAGLVELDDYLMSLVEFPKALAIQLSKAGTNLIGGPKLSLDLGIGLNDYIYMSETAKKAARARYGSYNATVRVNALAEIETNFLVNYITSEGMETLLSSQRSLRVAYKKLPAADAQTPSSFLVDVRGKAEPGNPVYEVPLFAYEVLFVDQNGERREMPYEISCRGSFNFKAAYDLTSGGLNTSQMSLAREFGEKGVVGTRPAQMDAVQGGEAVIMENPFPSAHATGSIKSDSYYHLLYQWGDKLRGSAEISIKVPQAIGGGDWKADRILSYDKVMNRNVDIEHAGTKKATPGQVLFTTSYSLDSSNPEVFKISIPIYVEPLPNHLVMTSNGIRSKWAQMDDVNHLADHQKVSLSLRLARPQSSELWAGADFNDDLVISYDEYISPEGVAARRAGRAGASPVPNTKIIFVPDPMNGWLCAKKTYSATSNVSGFLGITLPPGRWSVSRTTNELVSVGENHQGKYAYTTLSLMEQALMDEKYGADAATRNYAHNTIPMATISVPAAFYWRETDEYDTTPTAVVGAKLIQDLTGTTQDVLSGYELRQNVPPLKRDEPATADTIYQKLKGMYPRTDKAGYPEIGKGTITSRQVFDTAVLVFKEDSPYDLSLVGEYERRLESEHDTETVGIDIPMPGIGGSTIYNGYEIRRVIIDATTVDEADGFNTGMLNMTWTQEVPPFQLLPPSVLSSYTTGENIPRVGGGVGEGDIYACNLSQQSGHSANGKSFEALVYFKPPTERDSPMISLYNIGFGIEQQKRLTSVIRKIGSEQYAQSPDMYANKLPALHMWSDPSAAIIAGQMILIKAPTNHAGWDSINTELAEKSEGELMVEAMRAIDGGGLPKYPAGDAFTPVHNLFRGPAPTIQPDFDSVGNPISREDMVSLSQLTTEQLLPRTGEHYPGSLVFFETDLFPTSTTYIPDGVVFSDASLKGTKYLGAAQAHVEFVQEGGPLQAPQPHADEEDEYNMGFGFL